MKTQLLKKIKSNYYWSIMSNKSLNLFHTTGLFICPLKTSENQGFFDVFKEV